MQPLHMPTRRRRRTKLALIAVALLGVFSLVAAVAHTQTDTASAEQINLRAHGAAFNNAWVNGDYATAEAHAQVIANEAGWMMVTMQRDFVQEGIDAMWPDPGPVMLGSMGVASAEDAASWQTAESLALRYQQEYSDGSDDTLGPAIFEDTARFFYLIVKYVVWAIKKCVSSDTQPPPEYEHILSIFPTHVLDFLRFLACITVFAMLIVAVLFAKIVWEWFHGKANSPGSFNPTPLSRDEALNTPPPPAVETGTWGNIQWVRGMVHCVNGPDPIVC